MVPTLEERLLAIGGEVAAIRAALSEVERGLMLQQIAAQKHQAELRGMIERFQEYASETRHVEHPDLAAEAHHAWVLEQLRKAAPRLKSAHVMGVSLTDIVDREALMGAIAIILGLP